MAVVIVVVAVLAVVAIALGAVGRTVARLAQEPAPSVLAVEEAVGYIAERLPDEISARISYDDVRAILAWHLEYFDAIGMASRHGEQIGGDAVPDDADPVIAGSDESVDWVVEQAMAAGSDITALDVVCVLDLQLQYLREIGAVGPTAPDPTMPSPDRLPPGRLPPDRLPPPPAQ